MTGLGGGRGSRIALAAAVFALFIGGLVVFLLPFAYPTPPPVVGRFKSTATFSPNADESRDIARIRIRLNQRAVVNLDLRECGGGVIRRLMVDEPRPKGRLQVAWGGRDDAGRAVADGSYCLSLRAVAGKKKWERSHRVVIDTKPPVISSVAIGSAAILGRGAGECRVAVGLAERAAIVARAVDRGGSTVAEVGPRTVRGDGTLTWAWRGDRRGGGRVPAGPRRIVVAVTDAAGNRLTLSRSCWVGYTIGSTIPARPGRGTRVRVRLFTTAGRALGPDTPVILTLYRKVAEPGASLAGPLGARVARQVRGRLGRAELRLPPSIDPSRLWLVARTRQGRALITLGRR